jgi:hypothetical protein
MGELCYLLLVAVRKKSFSNLANGVRSTFDEISDPAWFYSAGIIIMQKAVRPSAPARLDSWWRAPVCASAVRSITVRPTSKAPPVGNVE